MVQCSHERWIWDRGPERPLGIDVAVQARFRLKVQIGIRNAVDNVGIRVALGLSWEKCDSEIR